MSRKIVAIGGGENGRIKSDGIYSPYETKQIDIEIIDLTGKKHPNFLFLGHSQNDINSEESYFHVMQNIYGNILGCKCQTIKKYDLKDNIYKVQQLINWADIIYEGGGDTKGMLELWLETGQVLVDKFQYILNNYNENELYDLKENTLNNIYEDIDNSNQYQNMKKVVATAQV